MKQIKLFSLVALVLSLSVSAAFASTGSVAVEDVTGKMCDYEAASLLRKQEVAKAEVVAPAAPVKEESTSKAVNAM